MLRFFLLHRVWHQRHMACALNSNSKCSLMLCTAPGNSSRKNLTSLGNKSLQLVYILVIDARTRLVRAEHANFLSSAGHSSLHRRVALIRALFLIEWHIYRPFPRFFVLLAARTKHPGFSVSCTCSHLVKRKFLVNSFRHIHKTVIGCRARSRSCRRLGKSTIRAA